MTRCDHANFLAEVSVGRLTDTDGGPVTGYKASIRIKCTDCHVLFRFMGLPFGSHPILPRLSADSTELRAPIEPAYTPELCGMPLVAGRA